MNRILKIFKVLLTEGLNLATRHWIMQRISSIALVPLTFLFIFPFIRHVGLEHVEIVEIYKNPIRALIAFLFLIFTVVHFKQGAEVVIEDYIHSEKINRAVLALNRLLLWFLIILLGFSFITIVLFYQWSGR